MSQKKRKSPERVFQESVLDRDGCRCVKCGSVTLPYAHRIAPKSEMPGGGLVRANGITLCPECMVFAEMYHLDGDPWPGYEPETLYAMVGSNRQKAMNESTKSVAR